MASVVFLRAINVGGGNLCKPAQLVKQLKKLEVVNIGAVGTFVVRTDIEEAALRKKFAMQLAKDFNIKCEIMIVPGQKLLRVISKDPFTRQPSGPQITRFMSVLHQRPPKSPPLPHYLPSKSEWLLKIIAIESQFVIGLYRREMKAIGYLGKIEKILGMPATTRSWNTIQKVVAILNQSR
ncbi:MAG TPA: DUF1697 domain-containing protein [Chthoniobacterales bacterium]|nr:DUF1697 domain-containing protein [Chthoniobacterales bacterium]